MQVKYLLLFAILIFSKPALTAPKICGQGAKPVYEDCLSTATVVEQSNGWYQQEFQNPRAYYVVDRVTQVCIMVHLELQASVLVPCENLKKRKEWVQIITWK